MTHIETLQFLLMAYSRLYISLHIFQMFCVGCGKLPGLIQCSLCHRQQGAGPLLCMTDWNEAAEPRCGQNTTLNTALPQLHTPDSTDSFPIHISPSRSGAAQGLARCLHWSSVGKGLREARMPATDFYPSGSLLSSDSLFQSPQALAAAVACTVMGKEGI